MSGLVVLVVALIVFASVFLLEPYYIKNQKEQLLEVYQEIKEYDLQDRDTFIEDLLILKNSYRVEITILDNNNNAIFAYNPEGKQINHKPLGNQHNAVYKTEIVDSESRFVWINDKNYKLNSIVREHFSFKD